MVRQLMIILIDIFLMVLIDLEMAERHDAREILRLARELILELQKLIDNK